MKTTKRHLLALSAGLALAALTGGAHAQTALDDVMKAKAIKIAVPTDFPPYGFVGTDLQPQGLDVDMAKYIATKLGAKIELVPVTSANRIPYLQTRKADLVISTLGKNPERMAVIDFTIAYSHTHPFVGEVRLGQVAVELTPEELDFPISIGDIEITECEMVNQFAGSKTEPPKFTRGYGLAFGHSERKAMAMSLVDRALRAPELGEAVEAPAQRQEFVLSHSDSLEASGFVQHLKLPHYVDFQSELELVRRMRAEVARRATPDQEIA